MKAEQASKSGERCLALLILLLQSEEISRAEIISRIPAYQLRSTRDGAQRKMLDRDLSTLERAGVDVRRSGTTRGAVYRVFIGQFRSAE